MVFIFNTCSSSDSLVYCANAFYVNIDLVDLHASEILYFVLHIADKVIGDRTDIYAIRYNHMEIQADLVVLCDLDTDTMGYREHSCAAR